MVYFANNFTDILRIRGISQKQFAETLGVRPSTVNQWAKGKREPSYFDLVKIITLLDVDFNEIMGYRVYQHNREGILRDIIGASSEFQKEQMDLQNEMFSKGCSAAEISQACETLLSEYKRRFEQK